MFLEKYYGYRTARVGVVLARLPRELMRPVEEELAKRANVHTDNHSAYVVSFDDGCPRLVLLFTDSLCVIGKEVIERNW